MYFQTTFFRYSDDGFNRRHNRSNHHPSRDTCDGGVCVFCNVFHGGSNRLIHRDHDHSGSSRRSGNGLRTRLYLFGSFFYCGRRRRYPPNRRQQRL